MTDKLDEFPEWYFETVEDAEELADHLNKKEELIQDIENAIETVRDEYKDNSDVQEAIQKIVELKKELSS